MSKQLTLVPVGGLANRMRTINSTLMFCKNSNRNLSIIWFLDRGLRCSFFDLFMPIKNVGVEVNIRDNSFFDLWLYDRPRRRNLYIPRVPELFMFDKCIYEDVSRKLFLDKNSLNEFLPYNKIYLASFFGVYPASTDYSMFRPIPKLQVEINKVSSQFNEHTIGVHIRRTDSILAIKNSPTQLFIDKMQDEIAKNTRTNFYLASDSMEVKHELKRIFGERLITSFKNVTRNTIEGIQDSLIDMFCLSHTTKIYGSFYSSFAETAAQLSDIPCVVLQKD